VVEDPSYPDVIHSPDGRTIGGFKYFNCYWTGSGCGYYDVGDGGGCQIGSAVPSEDELEVSYTYEWLGEMADGACTPVVNGQKYNSITLQYNYMSGYTFGFLNGNDSGWYFSGQYYFPATGIMSSGAQYQSARFYNEGGYTKFYFYKFNQGVAYCESEDGKGRVYVKYEMKRLVTK